MVSRDSRVCDRHVLLIVRAQLAEHGWDRLWDWLGLVGTGCTGSIGNVPARREGQLSLPAFVQKVPVPPLDFPPHVFVEPIYGNRWRGGVYWQFPLTRWLQSHHYIIGAGTGVGITQAIDFSQGLRPLPAPQFLYLSDIRTVHNDSIGLLVSTPSSILGIYTTISYTEACLHVKIFNLRHFIKVSLT